MGIDVYMSWRDMTTDEKEVQYTGFSIEAGDVGYLHESYHGNVYATQVLVPEGFHTEGPGAPIPAATLASRAEATVHAVTKRRQETYGQAPNSPETRRAVKSFVDFIELAKTKERETGEPVRIRVSW